MNIGALVDEYASIKDLENDILSGNPILNHNNWIRIFHYKLKFILKTTDLKDYSTWNSKLIDVRNQLYYENVRSIKIPYHLLSETSEYYQESIDPSKSLKLKKMNLLSKAISASDPLRPDATHHISQLNGNIDEVEELKIIILDIDRTFPTIPLFKHFEIRKQLVEILFCWYKITNIGYKQGFHEILAMIYLIVANKIELLTNNQNENDVDAMNQELENMNINLDTDFKFFELFNPKEIVSDTFIIFKEFIKEPIQEYYVEANLVSNCKTFDLLLEQFDKELNYNLMVEIKLENQIWLIRYYKLLLMRELPLRLIPELWDRLICFKDYNIFISSIILNLLLNIKKNLLLCDNESILRLLLNYDINIKSVKMDEFFSDVLLIYNAVHNNNLGEINNMLNLKNNHGMLLCKKGSNIDDFLHELRFNEKLAKIVKRRLK